MKRGFSAVLPLFLAFAISGCAAAQPDASLPELEQTDWPAVRVDAAAFGLDHQAVWGDPQEIQDLFGCNIPDLSLSQLCAAVMVSDGAAAEPLCDELYERFLEAPNTVLTYFSLLGSQRTDRSGESSAAEWLCRNIAVTAAAIYPDSKEFSKTIERCKEVYPAESQIASLLSCMETKYLQK